MDSLRLYFRFAATSLRAQMLYSKAFLLGLAGSFVSTIIGFLGIWALFARFHQVRGWSIAEIAVFYALVNIAFSIADAGTRGFDVFGSQFVRTANFDRVLLRPRTAVLQILGYQIRIAMFGRLLQALIILAIALELSKPAWGWPQFLLVAWTISGGVALFSGILVLQATLCFWTVESLEIANTLTYGGVEAAQYPLNIYAQWFRRFLTFVVPIGCVSYYPVAALLGRAHDAGISTPLAALAPGAGFVFLAMALFVWGKGIGHYTSAGG